MKTIIHISADFPDPIAPGKTKAVANLLNATAGFRHVVYSLNRTHKPGVFMRRFGDEHTTIAYGAPPYGIGLERFLRPVAAAISRDLVDRAIQPDLVHAHKFSVEGLVASELAAAQDSPFVCSLWGDTDIKIFEFKRGLRQRYRGIAERAQTLLPAAPWTGDYFRRALGIADGKIELLPVMTAADDIRSPVVSQHPQLISLFHLDSWKRKGLDQLVRAATRATRDIPDLTLDIYGTGTESSIKAANAIVQKNEAAQVVRLMGALPHGNVQGAMNGYTAFVMAPHRETYGMVHVEALLGGLPILWSRDRGVDGLFADHDVGYRADPTSVEDIARGIRHLVECEQAIKINIARLQRSNAFEHVRRQSIAATYSGILSRESVRSDHLAPRHQMAG